MEETASIQGRKAPGYYKDINHIIEEISQCDSITEFRVEHNGAYYACRKTGRYKELCSCLSSKQDVLLWNDKTSIHMEALKYKSMTEFAKSNGAAFAAAHRLAILDDVCSHMKSEKMDDSIVTDNCIKAILGIASECYDFDEFRKDHGNEYIAAIRNKIIEIVAHQIQQRAFAIEENELFNIAQEYDTFIDFEKEHRKECRAARQLGIITFLKELFKKKQRHFSRTKEQILEIASKCNSYKEFHDNYSLIYAEARRNNWLPDVFNVLPKIKCSKYTKETCISLAQKYKSRREFAIKEPSAYNAVLENSWQKDIDSVLPRKVSKPYDEKQILTFAESCSSYTQFIKEHRYAYVAASRLNILDKVKGLFQNKR